MPIFDVKQISNPKTNELIKNVHDITIPRLSIFTAREIPNTLKNVSHNTDNVISVGGKKRGRKHRRHHTWDKFWGQTDLEESKIQMDDLFCGIDLPSTKRMKRNINTIEKQEDKIKSTIKPEVRKYFKCRQQGLFDKFKKWSEEYCDCKESSTKTKRVAFVQDVQIREYELPCAGDEETSLCQTMNQLLSPGWLLKYSNKVVPIQDFEHARKLKNERLKTTM